MQQIDVLSDIFYNVGYIGPILIEEDDNYYTPKNAILFLDSTGKVFAFIELYLDSEAFGYRLSTEKLSIGELCIQKIAMLKKLFKEVGITYGTNELN